MARAPKRFPIFVTQREFAMILHALASTASTFHTAALVVGRTPPHRFVASANLYHGLREKLERETPKNGAKH